MNDQIKGGLSLQGLGQMRLGETTTVHVDKNMSNTAECIFVCYGDVTDDAISRFVMSHTVDEASSVEDIVLEDPAIRQQRVFLPAQLSDSEEEDSTSRPVQLTAPTPRRAQLAAPTARQHGGRYDDETPHTSPSKDKPAKIYDDEVLPPSVTNLTYKEDWSHRSLHTTAT